MKILTCVLFWPHRLKFYVHTTCELLTIFAGFIIIKSVKRTEILFASRVLGANMGYASGRAE